jgi:hypothetical protein
MEALYLGEEGMDERKKGFWITLGATVLVLGIVLFGLGFPTVVVGGKVAAVTTSPWPVDYNHHVDMALVSVITPRGIETYELGSITLGFPVVGQTASFMSFPWRRLEEGRAVIEEKIPMLGVRLQDGTFVK